jgi:LPS O-antigen subunit length determinant protein (WzzB/FepE family)
VAEQHINTSTNASEEISLTDIIQGLLSQKSLIAFITIIFGIVGSIYALTSTPIYSITAQLEFPSEEDLDSFKVFVELPEGPIYTPNIALNEQPTKTSSKSTLDTQVDPSSAFILFLAHLSTKEHIAALGKENKQLIKTALGFEANDNFLDISSRVRQIHLPNTIKKTNLLAPDTYTLQIFGVDREKLKELMSKDLELASKETTYAIKRMALGQVIQKIKKQTFSKENISGRINEKIKMKKSYLIASHNDRIKQLEAAYRIANSLGIVESTNSYAQLILSKDINLKFNDTLSPLYLRGSKFLKAEIDTLENLPLKDISDNDLRALEAQSQSMLNNPHLQQLALKKQRLEENSQTIKFYSDVYDTPTTSINPRKGLIVIISLVLGLLLAIFICISRIMFSKIKFNKV